MIILKIINYFIDWMMELIVM